METFSQMVAEVEHIPLFCRTSLFTTKNGEDDNIRVDEHKGNADNVKYDFVGPSQSHLNLCR